MTSEITTLDEYLTLLSKKTLNRSMDQTQWLESEELLADGFLAILRPFVSAPHIRRKLRFKIPPFTLGEIPESDVRLGAVNFRGLYQRNGRATKLEPCGGFAPRVTDHYLERHDLLHRLYMRLVHKAVSINHLFLATTNLDAFSVEFMSSDGNSADIDNDGKHATIKISTELAFALAPQEIRTKWSFAINSVLSSPWNDVKAFEKNLTRFVLPPEFSNLGDEVTRHLRKERYDLVFRNLSLLDQWRALFDPSRSESPAEAVARFEEWLSSLCWLQFYCRDDHAGRFFYTVRLPKLPGAEKALPDSSVSLVSAHPLRNHVLKTFIGLKDALSGNTLFTSVLNTVGSSFTRFKKDREKLLRTKGDAYQFAHTLATYSGPLPFDFDRVVFLIKMARKLVGQKHEGAELRFCFVFGFSRERIDAESQGLVEEVATGLNLQWEKFFKHFQFAERKESDVGEAMSKWIKTNDLQLQPLDKALFFEETSDRWPVPTSVIRIYPESSGRLSAIGTEIQLRHALRRITEVSGTTLGILVGKRGLITFVSGKTFIIPCNANDKWEEPVRPLAGGTTSNMEIASTFLLENLQRVFNGRVDNTELESVCSVITGLCEALVCLGHGALILVRAQDQNSDNELPPLNPVWCLRNTASKTSIESDCITYALMAALDGATEIVLPKKDTGRSILFGCRKSALTKKYRPIWHYNKDEEAALASWVRVDPLSLIGKGTRHHSALALSRDLEDKALVITVSADGPVTIWCNGDIIKHRDAIELRYAP